MGSLTGPDISEDVRAGDPGFQLDVGSVLARTFTVWAANVLPFTIVGVIVLSPVLVGLGAIALSGTPMPLAQRGLDLVSNVLALVLTGAVTYGVFRQLQGSKASLGEVLRTGLSRWGTVWATGILAGLATMLGFCALIIPGIVLMVRYSMAVPVAVIESPGASASLSRSTDLSEGNRWRIFALLLVVFVVQLAATLVLAAAIGAVSGRVVDMTAEESSAGLAFVLELVLIPVVALSAVTPAICYHDIRTGKEGADIEDLLSAFD